MTDHGEQSAPLMQIGALARATGVSVRALHHYDSIGLLKPRLYSAANVRRLHRIVALRRLGLALDEIAAVLDQDRDLVEAVRRHLVQVERSLGPSRTGPSSSRR